MQPAQTLPPSINIVLSARQLKKEEVEAALSWLVQACPEWAEVPAPVALDEQYVCFEDDPGHFVLRVPNAAHGMNRSVAFRLFETLAVALGRDYDLRFVAPEPRDDEPHYRFSRPPNGGPIFLRVPRMGSDSSAIGCHDEHGISDRTARDLFRQLNDALGADSPLALVERAMEATGRLLEKERSMREEVLKVLRGEPGWRDTSVGNNLAAIARLLRVDAEKAAAQRDTLEAEVSKLYLWREKALAIARGQDWRTIIVDDNDQLGRAVLQLRQQLDGGTSNEGEKMDKPPAGLKPRWLHQEERMFEVLGAMQRYKAEGHAIPEEWFAELFELAEAAHARPGIHKG